MMGRSLGRELPESFPVMGEALGRELPESFAPPCRWSAPGAGWVDDPAAALRQAGRLDEAFVLVRSECGSQAIVDVYAELDWMRLEQASLIARIDEATAGIVPAFQIEMPPAA